MKVPFMLDSGAYTVFRQGKTIDIDEYIKFIKDNILALPQIVYVNLDVIGDGEASYKNWVYMRKKGLKPLPVFHAGSDVAILKKYLKKTDYIGLGALANMTCTKRLMYLDRIWGQYLVDKKKMPICKVHGFGISGFDVMKKYPWYSTDSTSWFQSAVYGKILLPKRIKGKWHFGKSPKILYVTQGKRIKEKGLHFDTLTPEERTVLNKYLKFMNVPYGKSKFKTVDGKMEETIIEEGICNSNVLRRTLNALFYLKFMENLHWPRPMAGRIPEGFFNG